MPGATTRSSEAGREMAEAIIETVHLMYQNKTAIYYLSNLIDTLTIEFRKRLEELYPLFIIEVKGTKIVKMTKVGKAHGKKRKIDSRNA